MKNNNKQMMFDLMAIVVLFAVVTLVGANCSYEDDAERWQTWSNRKIALCRTDGGNPVIEPHWSGEVYKECILPGRN